MLSMHHSFIDICILHRELRSIIAFALLCLTFLSFLDITPARAQNYTSPPWNYMRNPHVRFNASKVGDFLITEITFKDHFGVLRSWRLHYPFDEVVELGVEFGIPRSIFRPYYSHEEETRNNVIHSGLFRKHHGVIRPDKSSLVGQSAELICRPIAQSIVATLSSLHRDTQLNRIRMAMKFVQDIPYGVPNFDDQDWCFGGVIPPPLIMMLGYGDCDSKSILYAGILSYLIDYRRIIFLNTHAHVLTAVRCEGVIGTHIDYRGSKYYLTETAGPGRSDIGIIYSLSASYNIEPLEWTSGVAPVVLPFGSSSGGRQRTLIASAKSSRPPVATTWSNRTGSTRNTNTSRRRTGTASTGNTPSADRTDRSVREGSVSSWRENESSSFGSGSRALLKVGGGMGYHQGSVSTPVEDWTMDYPVLLVHGCLGLPLSKNHLLVFYVTAGSTEYPSLTRVLQEQGAQHEINRRKDFYPFWEYEAGLLLFRFLRLSGGKGKQEFLIRDMNADQSIRLGYYSASIGLDLRFGLLGFEFTGSMLFGEQYRKRILRTAMVVNLYLSQ
jgi:hypothetical protein